MLERGVDVPFREDGHVILDIPFTGCSHELEIGRAGAIAARHQAQTPPFLRSFVFPLLNEYLHGFLSCQTQTIRHRDIPAPAGGERFQESPDLRQVCNGKRGLDALAAGRRQFDEQGQQDRREATGCHAAAEQRKPPFVDIFREDELVLESHPDPERNPATVALR